ncbi:MAG: hypothetical protein H7833_16130 [Magnetococcus sp. DMHC-1]
MNFNNAGKDDAKENAKENEKNKKNEKDKKNEKNEKIEKGKDAAKNKKTAPVAVTPQRIRALAFFADVTPPVLTLTAPAADSWINNSKPTISLDYYDTGSGVAPESLLLSVAGTPLAKNCTILENGATCIPESALSEGPVTVTAQIKDVAGNLSKTAQSAFTIDTVPPKIQITAPADGTLTNKSTQTLRAALNEFATVTLNDRPVSLGANLALQQDVVLQEGGNRLELRAVDRAGNVTLATLILTLDSVPPKVADLKAIAIGKSVAGQVDVVGGAGSVEAGSQVLVSNHATGTNVTVVADANGGFTTKIAAGPGTSLTLLVTDAAGNVSMGVEAMVPKADNGLPPDPASVAPPLQSAVPTQMHTAAAFLYAGAHPIQTGVKAEAMVPQRSVVLRGRVLTRAGEPLPGATVTVKDHPEFGQTLSRDDGMFDMAVNGGGFLVVQYALAGHLPAQRQIQTDWGDYYWLPDVALVTLDPAVTPVVLGSGAPLQTARGGVVTDADGARQATMLFPEGVTAEMVMPDGTTQSLTTLHVRATEYTVGPNGPQAMPAELPVNTAYTYAVELSVDEALAAGANQVRFSTPVPVYLENFLDFPVGIPVPSGSYDREKATWIPEENGRVIRIIGVTDGRAQLDITGDGQVASPTALTALGVTDAELVRLATLYTPGQSVWRVPVAHFSPFDWNWPAAPPTGALSPQTSAPQISDKNKLDDACIQRSSIIECENQVLGESVSVAGTPFSLNYRSDRVRGRKSAYHLEIPLSDAVLPPQLQSIRVEIFIAGRKITHSFAPAPNLAHRFEWDGLDVYGRVVNGKQPVTVRIGYIYPLIYGRSRTELSKSFGAIASAGLMERSRVNQTSTLWKIWQSSIGFYASKGLELGAWTLSAHHVVDGGSLYKGTGETRGSGLERPVLKHVAGGGLSYRADGIDAKLFNNGQISDMAVSADGEIYFVDSSSDGNNQVWKVTTDGIVVRVAGKSQKGFAGDGGQARDALLNSPRGLALGPDGSLYIADYSNLRIRKVDPTGIITTVAGNGGLFSTGDNGPAVAAQIGSPESIGIGPDGSVFILGNSSVRKVIPDGIISTVAGGGNKTGKIVPARDYMLRARGIKIGLDGALHILDYAQNRVYKLRGDGMLVTVAGNGTRGYGGDGGLATEASLYNPEKIAFNSDGSFYLIDSNRIVRRVGADGIIRAVAGNGNLSVLSGDYKPPPDGPLALSTALWPKAIAYGPDKKVYFFDLASRRIYQTNLSSFGVDATIGAAIAEPGGDMAHSFDLSQRHQRTVSSQTGKDVYRFEYDAAGLLVRIIDGDGDVTVIERAGKLPTAIVAADGQRTTLELDANGYLAAVTNPHAETHRFTYTQDGLLLTATTPREQRSTFVYDDLGRLIRDENPAGGHLAIAREETANGHIASLTSALGRSNRYLVETAPDGIRLRRSIGPDGTVTSQTRKLDGTTRTTTADGMVSQQKEEPDPRFGMAAPVLAEWTLSTPGGLTRTIKNGRTATLFDIDDKLSLNILTETSNINGRISSSLYNATTRTATLTTPAGRVTTHTIDPMGRPVMQHIAGLADLQYSYDPRGRLTQVSTGTGTDARKSTLAYGVDGYLASISDPLGRQTRYERDPVGRVVRQVLPDGREIRSYYDSNGNRTALFPPGTSAHLFQYDALDQEEAYLPPDLGTGEVATRYQYSLDKELLRVLRPDGQEVRLEYDAGGRLSKTTLAQGTYQYAFDTAGRLSTLTAPDGGTLTYTYDGSLPLSTTWSGAIQGAVAHLYDNNFRVTSQTVNGGNSIVFQYDPDDLLTRVGDLTLVRQAQNGLLTGTTLGSLTTQHAYDSFGAIKSFTAAQGGSGLFSTLYVRDKLGRITQKTETIAGQTSLYDYTYDPAGRLLEVKQDGQVKATYTYDANGNRLARVDGAISEVGVYDEQDRLVAYGDATYIHTTNGELFSKSDSGGTTHYDYDALGNLLGVTLANGTRLDYLIDGQNRRIGRKVNGVLKQGLLYQSDLNPIAELDGSGNLVTRFVYGSKANVPDYMVKAGQTYRILSDHLGSVRLVVSSTGGVVQQIDYDEYGRVTQDTNPGFQPFGFAGGLYDHDTGLVRFGVRDYDPFTGRWTAKDPIRFNGGDTNLYGYVLGDPVNYTDSNGLILDTIWDLGNVLYDVWSGNWVDAAADTAAMCVPFVPAGMTKLNKLGPIVDAAGPHTIWKKNSAGNITRHETFMPNPRNPTGWDKVQSTDLVGRSHTNSMSGIRVQTPHTHGREIPGGVRPATLNEIPRQ